MSNVANPITDGPPITPGAPVNRTLKITKNGGSLSASFEGVSSMPGDGPLDIRIYNDCVVTLALDTGNCDWEFDPAAAVTLGTPGSPGARYHNLRLATSNQRNVRATFEAAYLNITTANSDPYSMNFIVYTDPTTGAHYPQPVNLNIDPQIRNPGPH